MITIGRNASTGHAEIREPDLSGAVRVFRILFDAEGGSTYHVSNDGASAILALIDWYRSDACKEMPELRLTIQMPPDLMVVRRYHIHYIHETGLFAAERVDMKHVGGVTSFYEDQSVVDHAGRINMSHRLVRDFWMLR